MIKIPLVITLLALQLNAETAALKAQSTESGLTSILKIALEKSIDKTAAHSEAIYQESNSNAVSKTQLIPSVALSGSYQKFYYDRAQNDGTGNFIAKSGQNTVYAITVSYDLQKLFGPESSLAKKSLLDAQMQENITTRDLVRNVKKSYFALSEVRSEVADLNKLIFLFSKIENILQKQKKIGVFNELERQQFQVQKSILNSDLQTRQSNLDAAYFQLASLANISVDELKQKIPIDTHIDEQPHFTLDTEKISTLSDDEMVANLSREYNTSKLEFEKTSALPLPTIYIKGQRDTPMFYLSDGPFTTAEVGVSIPLDSLFTRSSQKSLLGAKADKNELLMKKALSDYRNQISLNAVNLQRFKGQTSALQKSLQDTEKLLGNVFLFYSQKRLDAFGTLDVFQKYLQTSKNVLINQMQIASTEAELEYLVGGVN